MEIEQSFSVPYPRDAVWARFHDMPGIVACLPGASLTAPVDNGMLKLAMTVKLGPIVASFAGDGEMKLDDAQHCGSITGTGVDRKSASRVKGVASFALEALGVRETRVDVKVDYAISGSLAQFSRGGIVKELATRMTQAFADNLKAKLDEAGAAEIGAAERAEPAPEVQAVARASVRMQPANAPLDVGNLFWKILWSRLRGLFSFASR
ncbi:SRPBCC family protein [Paraburkholderia bengalensis]|uniref:SRPBCC family protein n=1 Tax=Paraburkholderia bengalensis TaxID=2747562 RepID=A0ABU8ITX0_9BURK